ncbi:MAG: DUF4435 domain-containing protein [Pleurocapsa minor GSE-CHR-MK-17-07R]|jgi:hypothetical protein|nr:DUF4435 domain-containing protein [Pleurocapsa minor GSE-CHR-MK 17-07R]
MKFIDRLRLERETSGTTFLRFLKNQKTNSIHLFFEGDSDSSFYLPHIKRRYSGGEVYCYSCGGKTSVYDVQRKLASHSLTKPQAMHSVDWMCFVDKDLSDFLPERFPSNDTVYVTDYYSIENYLVNSEIFTTLLIDCFVVKRGVFDNHDIIVEKFESELSKFHGHLARIMAWSLYMQRNGHRVDHDSIKLDQIFEFDENMTLVMILNDSEKLVTYLDTKCSLATPSEYFGVEPSILIEFKKKEPKTFTRGKFEIWFLMNFLKHLKQQLDQIPELEVRYTEPLLSKRDIVRFLGPRLLFCPASLELFLVRNLSLEA